MGGGGGGSSAPQPVVAKPQTSTNTNYLTQNTEDAGEIYSNKVDKKTDDKVEKKPEQVVDNRLIYRPGANKTPGKGEGTGDGSGQGSGKGDAAEVAVVAELTLELAEGVVLHFHFQDVNLDFYLHQILPTHKVVLWLELKLTETEMLLMPKQYPEVVQ